MKYTLPFTAIFNDLALTVNNIDELYRLVVQYGWFVDRWDNSYYLKSLEYISHQEDLTFTQLNQIKPIPDTQWVVRDLFGLVVRPADIDLSKYCKSSCWYSKRLEEQRRAAVAGRPIPFLSPRRKKVNGCRCRFCTYSIGPHSALKQSGKNHYEDKKIAKGHYNDL